jgi:hypothetical protein
MLVTHPRNLLGKVRIRSKEEAIEFVRFFSSPYRHEMFDLDGLFEVTSSEEDWGQNIIKLTGLGDRFHPPDVTPRTHEGFCYDREGTFHECTITEYSIRRLAAFYDNNLYAVHEVVTSDGFYTLNSKELLLDDLSRFGLLHLPPH